MSAEDNLSHQQFPAVMPASDLLKYSVHYYEGTREEKDMDDESAKNSIFARKLQEAKNSGLYKDIKSNGVKSNVVVDHTDADYPEGFLYEGHHRVASAVDIDPSIPIKVTHKR